MDKVSIIVTAYNREQYLKESIDSCLNQTYPNVEVIVVDDCSTDNTSAILQEYGDRIRVITNDHNLGVTGAKNAGAAAISGDWMMTHDSDDILDADAVSSLMEFVDTIDHKLHDTSIVLRLYRRMDEQGRIVPTARNPPRDFNELEFQDKVLCLVSGVIPHGSFMVHSKVLEGGMRYHEIYDKGIGEDSNFIMAHVLNGGNVWHLDRETSSVRIHPWQATGRQFKNEGFRFRARWLWHWLSAMDPDLQGHVKRNMVKRTICGSRRKLATCILYRIEMIPCKPLALFLVDYLGRLYLRLTN